MTLGGETDPLATHHLPSLLHTIHSLPSLMLAIIVPPPLGPVSQWAPIRYPRQVSGSLVCLRRRSCALGSTLNGPCMVYATDTDQGRGGPTVGYRRAVVPKRGRGTPERCAGKCSPDGKLFRAFVPFLHACHWRRVVAETNVLLIVSLNTLNKLQIC